jgi:hypothetical protein
MPSVEQGATTCSAVCGISVPIPSRPVEASKYIRLFVPVPYTAKSIFFLLRLKDVFVPDMSDSIESGINPVPIFRIPEIVVVGIVF